MQNLPKNGSFVERRKVFVEFPFHSLNHQLPFNWTGEDNSTEEKLRKYRRSIQEQQYIKRTYDMKLDSKLKDKYNNAIDTFRVIPNQITAKQDQDALSKEIEQLEHSKRTPMTNPESTDQLNNLISPIQSNYQSASQLNNKPYVDSRYRPPEIPVGLSLSRPQILTNNLPQNGQNRYSNQDYDRNYNSPKSQQQNNQYSACREKSRYQQLPYLPKNYYGPDSLLNYRRYADLINSNGIETHQHRLRNYLPDNLEGFLREKSRPERKRPLNASLSLGNRQQRI